MKALLMALTLVSVYIVPASGQSKPEQSTTKPEWTEADRKYLLDNLIRSKEELLAETKNLTKEQWDFKEAPDRWSINQVVEHIALYEVIFMNEIAVALQMGPFPDFAFHDPDSNFVDQDPKGLKQNNTTDFTKPFTITVPLGNNEGEHNLAWVTKMRGESIEFIKTETRNMRAHYINFGPNVHQKCMMIFAHSDRHLRQIKKVKAHSDYPN